VSNFIDTCRVSEYGVITKKSILCKFYDTTGMSSLYYNGTRYNRITYAETDKAGWSLKSVVFSNEYGLIYNKSQDYRMCGTIVSSEFLHVAKLIKVNDQPFDTTLYQNVLNSNQINCPAPFKIYIDSVNEGGGLFRYLPNFFCGMKNFRVVNQPSWIMIDKGEFITAPLGLLHSECVPKGAHDTSFLLIRDFVNPIDTIMIKIKVKTEVFLKQYDTITIGENYVVPLLAYNDHICYECPNWLRIVGVTDTIGDSNSKTIDRHQNLTGIPHDTGTYRLKIHREGWGFTAKMCLDDTLFSYLTVINPINQINNKSFNKIKQLDLKVVQRNLIISFGEELLSDQVNIRVYNTIGQIIKTACHSVKSKFIFKFTTAGIYIVKIQTEQNKCVLKKVVCP
jgi:hypothetical protein